MMNTHTHSTGEIGFRKRATIHRPIDCQQTHPKGTIASIGTPSINPQQSYLFRKPIPCPAIKQREKASRAKSMPSIERERERETRERLID
jgi:hypothetical protein